MNKIITYIYCTLICLCFTESEVWAQKALGDESPAVKVIGFVGKNEIKLRWAPNTPLAWRHTNNYGFYIERHTIVKEGEVLLTPIIKRLNVKTILPKPMMEWEVYSEENDNAAIAAQALYGEDFEVEMENGGSGMMTIFNQAQVLEQRFLFALYAADQDYEVAKFSGLAYVDTDVKPNEKYLYKVFSEVPEEVMDIEFGGVYLGLQDYRELPQPQEFVGVFGDKSIMLSWNYKLLERDYNSYILERSEDNGKTFSQVQDVPITSLNNTEEQTTDRIMYVDSLSQNNKEYQYRVKGISPFGNVGPVSKIVKGKGIKTLLYGPAITGTMLESNNSSAIITWEFPKEGMETLAYFELHKSIKIKEGYSVLVSNIDKNKRTFTVNNLDAINYFKIVAVGNDGNRRKSFPQMVQPVDETPPATPLSLIGSIDSTGVVQLKWQQNLESDFLGYRVFRANLKEEEFTQITFEPIPESKIIDTINIKTLNKKIYYKVQSFDKRYNPSSFSEVLMLKRPDIIPPTQPVFKSFTADKGVVELNWITSSSEDAAKTLIYRKEKGSNVPWELIADVSLPQNQYKDAKAKPTITYLYTLVTMDESGLESDPVTPLTINLPDNQPKKDIERFKALVDREAKQILVSWNYKVDNVTEFMLYRASGKAKPTLYKVFEGEERKFIDKSLIINSNYKYLIQAVFSTGAKSMIKEINVKY